MEDRQMSKLSDEQIAMAGQQTKTALGVRAELLFVDRRASGGELHRFEKIRSAHRTTLRLGRSELTRQAEICVRPNSRCGPRGIRVQRSRAP